MLLRSIEEKVRGMELILWIPASYLSVLGIFAIINPSLTKDFILKYGKSRYIKLRGVILFILGILFMLIKVKSGVIFIRAVGITSVLMGILDFIFPVLEEKNILYLRNTPDWAFRLAGLLLLIAGFIFAAIPLLASIF